MMKRMLFIVIILLASFSSQSPAITKDSDVLEKLKLTDDDIPMGFMYGKLPEFAKDTLKNNPWFMDKSAIQKLANKIYPDGDYRLIAGIYVAIIASAETPHGDDIVCYIIQYKDPGSAKNEIQKLYDFVGYNKDRAILDVKNNIAVFLHVDDTKNFHYIEKINEKLKQKLSEL